jgi:alpha-glucosidase
MKKNRIASLAILVFLFLSLPAIHAAPLTGVTVTSPDNSTTCEISTADGGRLMYRVSYQHRPITQWSPMGWQVNGVSLHENTKIEAVSRREFNEHTPWRLGESDTLVNHCRQVVLTLHSGSISWKLIARAYDGSIAFRYEIKGSGSVQKEFTGFYFAEGPYTLYQYNQESVFTPTALDAFTRSCDLPATFESRHGYIHIGEADNEDYTKAELQRANEPNGVSIFFPRDSVVAFRQHLVSPWRTISMAPTAIDLHRYSQLNLVLSAPGTARNIPAWIKPGKLIRAQLTTRDGLDCIDFAAAHNFQYIMYDAGWYGDQYKTVSNPADVIPAIDMPKVIAYGKSKGIGVILYVNYVGLRRWLDTILPLYKQWGVAGLKFGFVDGLTQDGLTWLSAAMKKVYDYGFILDIHDNYKPTGLSSRFPELLTQEGVRGNENSPDAFHNTMLPFTRFLAGPADYTFCYPNASNSYHEKLKVSKAQQFSLTVIFFSPLQSMLWYGMPKEYTNEKEIAFFKYVPTVWNESHYLAGSPGKFIAVARRHGSDWFIGAAAGLKDWSDNLKLDFLKAGAAYTATVYEDDGNGSIRERTVEVAKGDRFPIAIKASGGLAMILRPTRQ